MKYLFAILLLTITVVIASAQTKSDSSKHLSFKGIPIDGALKDYISKMKNAGFTHIRTEDGIAILEGEFASYKNCLVAVSTMKQKDLVSKIGVAFPDRDTWSSLSGNYFNLKELLTEKYGNPSSEVEKFDTRSEPRDDDSKMYEVKFDRCKYYSIWETDKGEIRLSIDHISVSSCFVKLTYFDKINGAAVKKQALDDL